MARVTYTGISDYATRGAAAVNSIWTSFQTQSTAIGAENVRDEGLDRRNLAANIATDGYSIASYSGTNETFAPAGAYPTWNDLTFTSGPTAISINNGGSGWAVGTGSGVLRIRFTVEFAFDFTARSTSPFNTTQDFRWRISYVSNLGTIVPSVAQSIHRGYLCAAPAVGNPAGLRYFRDHAELIYLITGVGGETSVSSVKVQWASDGASISVGHCALQATRFVKVS